MRSRELTTTNTASFVAVESHRASVDDRTKRPARHLAGLAETPINQLVRCRQMTPEGRTRSGTDSI
jgi:hypothetical protein